MDRAALDRLTTEQLREEARRYQLQDSGDRRSLIEAIRLHFERHAPSADFAASQRELIRNEPTPSRTAADMEVDEPVTASTMRQAIMAVTEDILRHQRALQNQQMEFLSRQQEQLALLTQAIVSSRENPVLSRMPRERISARDPMGPLQDTSPVQASIGASAMQWSPNAGRWQSTTPTGNAVKWLATQIPAFGGSETDNVNAWIRRVEKVAEIHAANDGALLLAASSKLVGLARKWYDIQEGPVIESWVNLRRELVRMFDRKIPFYKAMARIEARNWNQHKETFDDYAIDKLALLQQLDLPVTDVVNSLIGGISQPMLRATALSLPSVSVERFLETMCHITNGISDQERKRTTPVAAEKPKILECRNCGRKGHGHQACRSQLTCFYCKVPGHRQYDCPNKKPGGLTANKIQPKPSTVAAAVADAEEASIPKVAAVRELGTTLEIASPLVPISTFCGKKCKLVALVDTGSPVSFVKETVYSRYCNNSEFLVRPSSRNLRNLCNKPLDIKGIVKVELALDILDNTSFSADMFVISNTTLEIDIIIGREFLHEHKLTLVYKPADQPSLPETNLFFVLPLHIHEDNEQKLKSVIDDCDIDFDYNSKCKLSTMVLETNKAPVAEIDDGHCVQVRLKDSSVYAYAPRRFAHSERLQLRAITDDLLDRQIIKPSVSPYCARVVPVRKRSGELRLCIDLRPLNARVERQRYSFPVIEECLSRLTNKRVFTLLDLRDSFH